MPGSHDRVIATKSAGALAAMVADWWAATRDGEHALMIATRNTDVDDLNQAARQRLRAAGLLHGPDMSIGGRAFREAHFG
jgi:hypothetical protein